MKINLDLNDKGNRVTLRCSWFPGVSDMCKAVSGASWSKTRSEWSYPLSMQTLRSLRKVFGDDLVSSDRLWQWAKAERATERSAARISGQKDAELRVIPEILPKMAEAMASRTYQRSGAAFVAAAKSCIIADEPGLGKTITALGAIAEAGHWRGDILVICPNTSKFSVWHQQILRWTGVVSHTMPDGLQKRKEILSEFMDDDSPVRILVVNKEMLRRQRKKFCHSCEMWEPSSKKNWPIDHHIKEHERSGRIYKTELKINLWPEIVEHSWEAVIFDEAHSVLASYKPSNVSQMMEGILDLKANIKLPLTGTPVRGNELNLWGYLDWIGANTGGYWGFASSYFQINDEFFGKTIGGIRDDAREEFENLLSRYMLRRTRSEVRPDLPLGRREDILVEMSGAHEKQYREFERMGEAELESGTVSGKGVLSQLTRMMQMAFGTWKMVGGKMQAAGQSPKVDWLVESFLAERGVTGNPKTEHFPEEGEGFKYVVASKSNEVLDAVSSQLAKSRISSLRIDGSVSGNNRQKIIRQFNNEADKTNRVLLLNSKAGGESIDLDAWCDEMVILDETFIADDQVQLEGRINNRSGRVAPRTWWYVRTKDTIDQAVAEQNYRQHNLQHLLLDGRRGVELALHLIRSDNG